MPPACDLRAVRPTAVYVQTSTLITTKRGRILYSRWLVQQATHTIIVRYLVTEAGADTAGRCVSRWDHGCSIGALVL